MATNDRKPPQPTGDRRHITGDNGRSVPTRDHRIENGNTRPRQDVTNNAPPPAPPPRPPKK